MVLTDSILNTTKHMLGVEPEYTHFDNDIINDINMALNVLAQIGGVPDGTMISGVDTTYADILGEDVTKAQMVKTYIYLKTKLAFDPPLSGSISGIIDKQIAELEWRLNVQLDNVQEEAPNGVDDSE